HGSTSGFECRSRLPDCQPRGDPRDRRFRTAEGGQPPYDEGERRSAIRVNHTSRRIMKQSPLLIFECAAFAVIPGEDEQTNPGIYGKSLALWLAERLRSAGFAAGAIIAEDFGWCIPVDSKPHSLYVACAGTG